MKLSLDALKDRAEATASMDLLATISGGTENACHPKTPPREPSAWEIALGVILIICDPTMKR